MIRIGIIDSGFDFSYKTFNKIVVTANLILNDNYVEISENPPDCFDSWGHGTTCCLLIDGYSNNLEFIIVKIFDDIDNKSNSILLAKAVEYCIEQNVDIINMSLGLKSNYMPDRLIYACEKAYSVGVVLVAATSNSNEITFPAHHPYVIGVGNIPEIDSNMIYTAPSLSISTYMSGSEISGDKRYSSTSFSCAKVTGTVARILSENKNLKIEQIEQIIDNRYKRLPKYILESLKDNVYKKKVRGISIRSLRNRLNKYISLKKKDKVNILLLIYGFNNPIVQTLQLNKEISNFEIDFFDLEIKNQDTLLDNLLEKVRNTKCIGIGNWKNLDKSHLYLKIIEHAIRHQTKIMIFDYMSYEIIRKMHFYKQSSSNSKKLFDVYTCKKLFEECSSFRFLPSISVPKIGILCINDIDITNLAVLLKKMLEKQNKKVSLISTNSYSRLIDSTIFLPPNLSGNLSLEQEAFLIENLMRGLQHIGNFDYIISAVGNIAKKQDQFNFSWLNNLCFFNSVNPPKILIYIDSSVTILKFNQYFKLLPNIVKKSDIVLILESELDINKSLNLFLKKRFPSDSILYLNNIESERNLLHFISRISSYK